MSWTIECFFNAFTAKYIFLKSYDIYNDENCCFSSDDELQKELKKLAGIDQQKKKRKGGREEHEQAEGRYHIQRL